MFRAVHLGHKKRAASAALSDMLSRRLCERRLLPSALAPLGEGVPQGRVRGSFQLHPHQRLSAQSAVKPLHPLFALIRVYSRFKPFPVPGAGHRSSERSHNNFFSGVPRSHHQSNSPSPYSFLNWGESSENNRVFACFLRIPSMNPRARGNRSSTCLINWHTRLRPILNR